MGIRQLLGAEPWGKMAKGKEGLGFGPGCLSGCNQGYCGTGMERGLQTVSELFSVLENSEEEMWWSLRGTENRKGAWKAGQKTSAPPC